MGEVRDTLLREGRKSIVLLQGSQASPARPSDKSGSGNVRMVRTGGSRKGPRNFDFLN
jgi:hypothetical protein